MIDPNFTILGERNVWGGKAPYAVSQEDRRTHLYILGQTGTGKTTLLKSIIMQDINAGRGLAFLDPHGDCVQEILELIPPDRIKDVIYFDPMDVDFPIALNLLQMHSLERRHLVTSSLIEIFRSRFKDSWGPRLEYVLNATISALLYVPDATILSITRMLTDPFYRHYVVEHVTDSGIRAFWENEFPAYSKQLRAEVTSPIQNKVNALSFSTITRNILGQSKNTFNFREIMDGSKIFLANLSKGALGEEKSSFLGAILSTSFQLSALSRADMPIEERRDFSLIVDEFHNCMTASFTNSLSEVRKYRLNMVLSHQYLDQLTSEIKKAVFGNVPSKILFRLGATDGKELNEELEVEPETLASLDNFRFMARLLRGGGKENTTYGSTLPIQIASYNLSGSIKSLVRANYATEREAVERAISSWYAKRFV